MNDLEGHTDDFDVGSVLYYYCIFSQSLTVFFFSNFPPLFGSFDSHTGAENRW